MVNKWKNYGETVEQLWWKSRTDMEEQWNNHGGTVEQIW